MEIIITLKDAPLEDVAYFDSLDNQRQAELLASLITPDNLYSVQLKED